MTNSIGSSAGEYQLLVAQGCVDPQEESTDQRQGMHAHSIAGMLTGAFTLVRPCSPNTKFADSIVEAADAIRDR
ncbi:MAG: hypothetical protein KIT86_03405 [Hydrogenophaga sp.]|uniref:hypothetical protein n=1 Tax=Hydrogenophaga sp. TaxID=1904254 RepID=UPI0026269979|nr:hypothetical protein [Hydrogenophaga sp.]MCW5668682.1 hypothetical protein [Hydrogenophaga sp.]